MLVSSGGLAQTTTISTGGTTAFAGTVIANSGMLTVTSGGSVVAAIDFSGSYTTSSFHITSGTSGTVEIFDPPLVSTASLVSGCTRVIERSHLRRIRFQFAFLSGAVAGGVALITPA